MRGSVLFIKMSLAADPAALVRGLNYLDLCQLRNFVDEQDHASGFVGLVGSLCVLVAAEKFYEEDSQAAVPVANTAAEGLDMADRGVNF